jgi:Zn-finger nucleic acid-binding protein
MDCPKCNKALRSVKYEAQLLTVDRCVSCKGIWLDKGELAQYGNAADDMPDFDKSLSALKPTKFPCPNCKEHKKHEMLFELPYTSDDKATFSVDYCKVCQGLWLDALEINSAQSILQKLRIQKRLKK